MSNVVKASGGFNTGRLYSAEGQRIYWEKIDSGDINFADIDRMIYGTLNAFDGEPTPANIIREYDAHRYYMGPIMDVPDIDFGQPLQI